MRSISEPADQHPPSFIEAARRAQIIAKAIETFAELGYAQASLAEIAKRAGISKGVIAYHFGSKDALTEQVVAEVLAVAEAVVGPPVRAEATPDARLRAFIAANIDLMRTHRTHMLALAEIWSGYRRPDGRPHFGAAAQEPYLRLIEQTLREGQAQGRFRQFDARAVAVALRAALDGVLGQLMIHPDLDLDLFGRELVALFDLATRPLRQRQEA